METENTKRHKKYTKRKIIDSSESETDSDGSKQGKDSKNINNASRRQSSRLFQKECKPKFSLPSRDVIWDNIPSQETLPRLKRLTPKKTVNNFTKVYNAYNFDDYEDTSDGISSDESSELDDEDDKKRQTTHRIQNYHKRIIQMSSSDDEKNSQSTESLKEALPVTKKAKYLASHIQSCSNEDSDDLDSKFLSSKEIDIQDSEDSNICSPSLQKKHNKLADLASDDSDDSIIEKKRQSDSCHEESNLDSDSSSSSSGAKKCRSEKLKERRSSLLKKLQEAKQRKHSKLNSTK
ncbi:unnamed protein product [Lymnaea stagnalis]|uniref:Uncharacterized protein n=1 Tax=Lymnaea stagnalis TaxID=6523 RepID=A0AAV2I3X8_LYMST